MFFSSEAMIRLSVFGRLSKVSRRLSDRPILVWNFVRIEYLKAHEISRAQYRTQSIKVLLASIDASLKFQPIREG